MARHRYFIFNQNIVLVLGVLHTACAALCLVCGLIDATFRKDTPLSSTRTPVWGALVVTSPGVLALFASQRKNSILVSVMVLAAGLSCVVTILVSAYSCLTLTYGEEDADVFHQHSSPQVTFVLHRMVKGANATILLSCVLNLLLSCSIIYVGCRSLPTCGCYDTRTGLETLVPQVDPEDTEMVCTWQAGGDERLFNSAVHFTSLGKEEEKEAEAPTTLPTHVRLI